MVEQWWLGANSRISVRELTDLIYAHANPEEVKKQRALEVYGISDYLDLDTLSDDAFIACQRELEKAEEKERDTIRWQIICALQEGEIEEPSHTHKLAEPQVKRISAARWLLRVGGIGGVPNELARLLRDAGDAPEDPKAPITPRKECNSGAEDSEWATQAAAPYLADLFELVNGSYFRFWKDWTDGSPRPKEDDAIEWLMKQESRLTKKKAQAIFELSRPPEAHKPGAPRTHNPPPFEIGS